MLPYDRQFVPGLPDEWESFAARNGRFLEEFETLKVAVKQAFEGTPAMSSEPRFVIYALVRQIVQDYTEVLLLAANGYGLAAKKLLRGMYERLVTARWLHSHPDETSRFLAWELVQRARAARSFLESFGEVLDEPRKQQLRAVIAEAEPVRGQFMVTDCEKCHTQRLNHTWSSLDFVAMAKAVGDNTSKWLGPAYYEPLNYVHASAASLGKLMEDRGDVFAFRGVHRADADQALGLGHYLVLNALDLIREIAVDSKLNEALRIAFKSYQQVCACKAGSNDEAGV